MMPRVMIVAGFNKSLILFRKELIEHWLKSGYEVTAAAPGLEVEEALTEMGVSYHNLHLERTGLNPVKDFILLLRLIQLLKKERPDYLYLYTIKPVIYGSIAARFLPSCRVFSMITGLGYAFTRSENKGKLLRKVLIYLYRIALKRNRKVFFQNPDDEKYFVDNGIVEPDKVVRVNGSGVNIDYYSMTPHNKGEVSFLLIARLLKEKGIVEYIEAARKVKKKYPETRFMLVGWSFDDNPTAIGQEQIEEWQKEGIVEIYCETDDVRPYIAKAAVYVLPSYREGTPRTVLEAMAMGRAVITTDVPGCRETVKNGVNGFLVPVKDSEALAEAMVRFIEEPDLIEKMGKESRRLAEERFDVYKVNRVINQVMGL